MRLEHEKDEGLSVAYASALGKLGVGEALPILLARLATCDDEAMCVGTCVGGGTHCGQ